MAALDEQLVEEWLNRSGFFTMRGVKVGLSELDLLAVRPGNKKLECWHVEVQISFRPMGYIGGDNNAKKRTPAEVAAGIDHWIEKKFLNDKVTKRRNELVPNQNWRQILVHAVVRHPEELELLRSRGIETKPYIDILNALKPESKNTSSSTASQIAEILSYGSAQTSRNSNIESGKTKKG